MRPHPADMGQILGYVTPACAFSFDGCIQMHAASGRIAEELARHYHEVYVCCRVVKEEAPKPFDFPLDAANLEIIPQPFWRTTAGSIPHFFGIAASYTRTCRLADVVFVRGMCPYTAVLYGCAAVFRKPICHWIVGDAVTLLRSGKRNGHMKDLAALLYALQDRAVTKFGRWLANGILICNGKELARVYASPRTVEVVSSTIRDDEFFFRRDTCQRPVIRILFAGFIRPEKGIEYLLEAVSRLGTNLPWELEIAGSGDFCEYRGKLAEMVAAKGIGERVHWTGYVPYGRPLFDRMRAADILVLPTISEGTPHVLVEAKANGLPCISTRVGGVPATVTDGYDALLVPPKDPQALAEAIERVVRDGDLRRALIRNGLASARRQSLNRFVVTVLRQLEIAAQGVRAAVPQP